ncbi:MAG: Ig-like domain-containing protein, partial [Chloroflexi bacterium]|nr:Ig-like domain-containing protein [Chloroflexota bacterium]
MTIQHFLMARQQAIRFGCGVLCLLLFLVLLWPPGIAHAATFTVTNINDSGPGSLRQAILDANARSGADLILFNLGSGVQTIKPTSALPAITDVVEINALSGGACATMPPQPHVQLDGSLAGNNASGFKLQAANSRIVGFYINRFSAHGIEINASNNVVSCNVIGLTPQNGAAGNVSYGVKLNGNNNIVGNLGGLVGNVVSANAFGIAVENANTGNIIRGNFVGTDLNGVQARGNSNAGIGLVAGAANTTIGGATSSDRNVISGNGDQGLWLIDAGSNNEVTGNFIGLNATGNGALPNGTEGIMLENSDGNTIGGIASGQGNRIAFNTERGVAVTADSQNNRILGNQIFSNGKLGIDLGKDGVTPNDNGDPDSGANDKQNSPLFAGAFLTADNRIETEVVISSLPNTTFRIEIFASESCDSSGTGEGATFLGSATLQTNSGGNGLVDLTFNQAVPPGQQLTATATNNSGNAPANTSEFSACQTVVAQSPPAVPQALPDTASTQEDTPVTINVLGNDTRGASGRPLAVVAVGKPAGGTATIVNNQVLYTPNTNFNGGDTFFYSINDGDSANTRQTTVRVQVEPVNDAPTDILFSAGSINENIGDGNVVGNLTAIDADSGDSFTFSLVGADNDNAAFSLFAGILRLTTPFDFERKPTITLGVRVRDRGFASFTKNLVIPVGNVNDAPTAINLSNSLINENQAAGATVGTLSSTDSDAGDSHTYALVEGSGSDDNASFRIEGNILKTNAVLDFETKPIYSARIRSTDRAGASFERIVTVNLNNLPSPPDAIPNRLAFCSGQAITLIDNGSTIAGKRVLVKIDPVTISNKTSNSCTVSGKLSVTSNGSTVSNLTFSGDVNDRNQFRTSTIPDFTLSVAGIPLLARSVVIAYNNERPHLHITRPALQMPKEFGGLSAGLAVPTLIDSGGVRFGTGKINLPTISTSSGFEMSLSGSLVPVGDGFQISADGTLSIPNIGKKKTPGAEGQTCTITAGVTIFANAQQQTVMVIAAGEDQTRVLTGPYLANAAPATLFAPDALAAFRLDKVRAGASCDPGLPIGQTGLFLTGLGGEITLIPGNERVDVTVTIEAGKSLPVLGPILSVEGSMGFQPRPFQLDLGVAVKLLSIEVARADATITTTSFRTTLRFQALFYNGTATITAFTRNGKATFTGSGRVAIEVKKGSLVAEECNETLIGTICFPPAIPPFDTGELAAVGADVGEFTNGRFGFKGFVKILIFGTHGFYVDEKGDFSFTNVDKFKLVAAPQVAAARTAALAKGETIDAAAVNGGGDRDYTFFDAGNGKTGVIISAALTKPAVDLNQVQAAGATDIITTVNLIQNSDVVFNLTANAPLAFTLITPEGKEVTPANYTQSADLGYTIEYLQRVSYEPASTQTRDNQKSDKSLARLLFTQLAGDALTNGSDLRIDGVTVYFALDFQNSVKWLKPIPLTAGAHTVELLQHGTSNVVRSGAINLVANTNVSLFDVSGPAAGFVAVTDDNAAPATIGKTRVRFFNGANATLNLLVNGTPILSNIAYKATSPYVELDAGVKNIELRTSSGNTLVGQLLATELAAGGVYTFLSTDYTLGGFDVTLLQREDARYAATYLTYYSVDQAQMNSAWQMKLVGDTANTDYNLAVWGASNPPVLGSVTVNATTPAATQVSWQ